MWLQALSPQLAGWASPHRASTSPHNAESWLTEVRPDLLTSWASLPLPMPQFLRLYNDLPPNPAAPPASHSGWAMPSAPPSTPLPSLAPSAHGVWAGGRALPYAPSTSNPRAAVASTPPTVSCLLLFLLLLWDSVRTLSRAQSLPALEEGGSGCQRQQVREGRGTGTGSRLAQSCG